MKGILLALLCAGTAHASNDALECLKAGAKCLGETLSEAAAPVAASASYPTQGLTVTTVRPEDKKGYRNVPTPTGWRQDEDGTATTGFYKGMDSGFKTVFAGITIAAVAGIEACGGPYRENIGTAAFLALGVVLSIPAAALGAVIGAPVGAAAGVIAEKVSPGSTKDWYSF